MNPSITSRLPTRDSGRLSAVPALRMSLQYDRRSMLQISALAPLAVVAPGVRKASAAEDEAYDPRKFEPLIKDLQDIVKADKWFVSFRVTSIFLFICVNGV
jgi:hypothetical protein